MTRRTVPWRSGNALKAARAKILDGPCGGCPGDFGAIAYFRSTKVVSFGAGGDQSSAQNAVVAGCKSQGGGDDCAVYLWFEDGYGALAISGHNFGTGWGTSAQDASMYAIRTCQQEGGTNCAVVYSAHMSDTPAESPSEVK